MDMNENEFKIPVYEAEDSDCSEGSTSSFIFSKETSTVVVTEEYDEDGLQYDNIESEQTFNPLLDHNIFIIDRTTDTILIGLNKKQKIFLSGVFKLQIVKGGIVYNNIHYNASKDQYTMWHPNSSSIPVVQSSFYAGWDEATFIESKNREYLLQELKGFDCVLKIQNGPVDGLFEAKELYKDLKFFWGPLAGFTRDFLSGSCTFHILRDDIDPFATLDISADWSHSIEKLKLVHHNLTHDMRLLILGGKNSGKSTFLRLLIENFMMSGPSQRNSEDLLYLDLDPGQPEYSDPECISLNRIVCSAETRGNHLGQPHHESLKQYYIGSNSPQDAPEVYLKNIKKLIQYLDEEAFVGTSLVNLPGWVKGFGINILNEVIGRYKPTNIVLLESTASKKFFDEIIIPDSFTNYAGLSYTPEIIRMEAKSMKSENLRFSASQLRTFKLLAYFHTVMKDKTRIKYDFTPLVKKKPLQISYGSSGIKGVLFFEEFANLNSGDIKMALEGTIVGIYTCSNEVTKLLHEDEDLPILCKKPAGMNFHCLALIHSINTKNKYLNLYVPDHLHGMLEKDGKTSWLIFRGKTETPLCEVYPPGNIFTVDELPFISTERRKKYEHVWKVRKNILRRGQHMS